MHGSSYLASRSDIFSEIDEGGMESIIENKNVGSPRSSVRARPSHMTTPPAAKMYEHIAEQQRRIDALQSSCDKQRSKGDEGDRLCHQLRLRVQEAQQVREKAKGNVIMRLQLLCFDGSLLFNSYSAYRVISYSILSFLLWQSMILYRCCLVLPHAFHYLVPSFIPTSTLTYVCSMCSYYMRCLYCRSFVI